MKIQARCPHCGQRVPRHVYFTAGLGALHCATCRTPLRLNLQWERMGNNIAAAPVVLVIVLVFLGFIPWWVAIAVATFVFFIGWLLFPYVTRCERVKVDTHPKCYRCGYDLYGTTSDRCPECGEPVPDDISDITTGSPESEP